ncbi:MAG: OmpW family protein [Gammaproteobacteria bacterium]|nr:OmpW family protein [Gammaproteobacteria bacterium]
MKKHFLAIVVLITTISSVVYAPVSLADTGDWLVRLRALHVSPNDDSGSVSTLPGSNVSVGSDTTVELDFTYFVTRNLGIEVILGSSQHDINAGGSIAGLGNIAEVRTLPPTVTLQYHFLPDSTVRPYAGIGINYTKFYNQKVSSSLENALGPTSVDLDSSLGLSGQIGLDINLNQDWFVNVDVKYIHMDTTATLNSGGVIRTVDVDINPGFFGVGVGRRF